jgi:uncharacterized protein
VVSRLDKSHSGARVRYAPSAFCGVGLATSDPAGATTFYARLFEWHSENLPVGELGTYTVLRRDGSEVAILYRQTREARAAQAAPHWTPFVSVENADASALRAQELGGVLLRGPLDLADGGRVAALRDPTGGIVSFWQPRSKAGAELVNTIGALSWLELATTAVSVAMSFYGRLLGWEFETGPDGYTMITNAGSRIGTIGECTGPAGVSGWVPYFGVERAEEAQRKATRHGGRPVTPPTATPVGRVATLADPQGAAFAVLERSPTSSSWLQRREVGEGHR